MIIDFETRCRTPITVGASRYSLDAEVLCLAYQAGDEIKCWYPGEPDPQELFEAIERGEEIFAHNATFEKAIWRNVMVPQYGWPPVPEEQWRCTQAECLSLNLPASLEQAGLSLGLADLKDTDGHKLMLKMSKPRKPTKHNKAEWHEKPEDMQRLRDYCVQDVRAEAAIHAVTRRLSAREQAVYHFDSKVNLRGVRVDRDLVESVVAVWKQYEDRLTASLQELTFGFVNSASCVQALCEYLQLRGVKGVYDMTKDSVEYGLNRIENLPFDVRQVLEIRSILSLSSIKKFHKILACIEPDDRIRGCFQYHGASQTGRWAGRLVQLQNLPRGELATEDLEPMVELVKTRNLNQILKETKLPLGKLLSSLVRSAFIPSEGKKFIICDFAGIEARGLAWAAGEQWLLDAFRLSKDIYIEMASAIYDIPYDKVNKDQRFYGKQAVLGCGYGMGGTKFQSLLESYGVQATSEFCDQVIRAYRKKNTRITRLWRDVEKAAVEAVQTFQPRKVGPFIFHVRGDWLHARLPCGRNLAYHKPKLAPGKYGPQIEFNEVDATRGKVRRGMTYGGKLVENCIQALCRDLLVDAMAQLEKAGYEVVAHVHDEVVVESDEFGSIEDVKRIMERVPDWAKGFPINAEGFEAMRYRK